MPAAMLPELPKRTAVQCPMRSVLQPELRSMRQPTAKPAEPTEPAKSTEPITTEPATTAKPTSPAMQPVRSKLRPAVLQLNSYMFLLLNNRRSEK